MKLTAKMTFVLILLVSSMFSNGKYFIKTIDFTNLNLCQAKSYEALNRTSAAIDSYKKIDSILQNSNYKIPEIRAIYRSIVNYYKLIGDKNQQLMYVNKLLRSDSIWDIYYKYGSNKLIKDYDMPIFLSKKEIQIDNLEPKQSSLNKRIIVLIAIICICAFFLIRFYSSQKKNQELFRELVQIKNIPALKKDKREKLTTNFSSDSIDVPKKVINKVLANLKNFEEKRGFLKININVSDVANFTNTNQKYLSKIINIYKQKRFSNYINDLRIDFIIEKLKNDDKYRRFTIKALAGECGFNTAEAFSKYFYKKTGIYPSYFIKQLNKEKI